MIDPTSSAPHPALWNSPWPAEDGGPARRQAPNGSPGFGLRVGDPLVVTSRLAMVSTMVVLREPGEVYLLSHTGGDDAVSWVEQVHPETLETLRRSPDLPGGPTWPGGLVAHADGSLYAVFGNHAHRLSPSLEVLASVTLPRVRPYNSFVVLPDGHLVTKDFGGARPGHADDPAADDRAVDTELLVLAPGSLAIVARCTLPERSIARLSADGDDVYVVGDTSLMRARWDGGALTFDESFRGVYRTLDGQTYGWDAVIDAGAAWFLDNGGGNDKYAGTFRGVGTNTAPLHLVRVGLDDSAVSLTEICGLPGGLVANPPAVDAERRIVVGFDSGNGVVVACRFDEHGATSPLWRADLNQAAHMLRFPDTGELLVNDHDAARGMDQLVVLDIETGAELARVDTGSPVQSVVFPAVGWDHDVYLCSFTTLTRVHLSRT